MSGGKILGLDELVQRAAPWCDEGAASGLHGRNLAVFSVLGAVIEKVAGFSLPDELAKSERQRQLVEAERHRQQVIAEGRRQAAEAERHRLEEEAERRHREEELERHRREEEAIRRRWAEGFDTLMTRVMEATARRARQSDVIAVEKPPAQTLTPTAAIGPEMDSQWQEVIWHPSIVLILGKRGSGKSALGYRLLEIFKYGLTPYVVGVPTEARQLLPEWVGIAQTLEDVPAKSIVLVDEAYLLYHSRDSQSQASKDMSRFLNLSRQREQTLIFIAQESRQIDRNVASSANVVTFKKLGMLQVEFERAELSKIATEAKALFAGLKDDRRNWSYVYSPDTNFMGLLKNSLPTFWSRKLSHVFAAGGEASVAKSPKGPTLEERVQKAWELRRDGLSFGQIARALGVTKGTAYNYVKGYPYKA